MIKDLDAIARKYGGTATLDEIAAKYGGTVDSGQATTTGRPQPVKFPRPLTPIEPPVPPATLGGLGAEFGIGLGEALGVQPAPTIRETAIGTARNYAAGVGSLYEAGKDIVTGGGTGKMQSLLGGVAQAPIAPFQTIYEGIQAGDPNIVARGAGGVTGVVAPMAGAAADVGRGIQRAAGRVGKTVTVRSPEELVHSMLRPNEKMFEFGADPVQAVIDVTKQTGRSWTLPELKDRITRAGGAQESIIRNRLKQHRQQSLAKGVPNVYDQASNITSTMDQYIQDASESGKSTATLERYKDGYLRRLKREYGGTHLDPDQILKEKRHLGNQMRFNESLLDPETANLRQAQLQIYRNYDKTLDSILGPDIAGVNQRWSGLIEAEKMLDREIFRRKSLPYTGVERWRLKLEPGIKTSLISAAGTPSPIPPPSMPNLRPRTAGLIPAPGGTGSPHPIPPTPFQPSPGANRLNITTGPPLQPPTVPTTAGIQADLLPHGGPGMLSGPYAALPPVTQEFLIELKRRGLWREGQPIPKKGQLNLLRGVAPPVVSEPGLRQTRLKKKSSVTPTYKPSSKPNPPPDVEF